MVDLLLFPAVSALVTGLTPLNWHGKLPSKAREGVLALQQKGHAIHYDPGLFKQTELVVGLAAVALAAGASAAILALLQNLGQPDMLQRLGSIAVPAFTAAFLYPRRVLVTYWGRQAYREGVDLDGPVR